MSDFPYEDILYLPHHVSKKHKQMPMEKRAAQFAPFAALVGHAEAIAEAARFTEDERELSETELAVLDLQHMILLEHVAEQPEVTFTYFLPDGKKAGGAYVTKTGRVRKVDEYKRVIIMADGSVICMDTIKEMRGEIFVGIEVY